MELRQSVAVKACIHYPINSHSAIIHQLNGVCTTTNADMLYLFLARWNAQFLAISLSDVFITAHRVCMVLELLDCFSASFCHYVCAYYHR